MKLRSILCATLGVDRVMPPTTIPVSVVAAAAGDGDFPIDSAYAATT
jgi:hypothetical protein